VAVSVWRVQSVQFRQCNGLNHGELFGRAIAEVMIRVFAIEAMKQLYGAQPTKAVKRRVRFSAPMGIPAPATREMKPL